MLVKVTPGVLSYGGIREHLPHMFSNFDLVLPPRPFIDTREYPLVQVSLQLRL